MIICRISKWQSISTKISQSLVGRGLWLIGLVFYVDFMDQAFGFFVLQLVLQQGFATKTPLIQVE